MSAAPSPFQPDRSDADPGPGASGADLLDHLLGSLLEDFRVWFDRGLVLLDLCPDAAMAADQRRQLREDLELARKELAAASSLRRAAPAPMALALETMGPWHQLVMRVWSLSARLRALDVPLPQLNWPEPPPFLGLPPGPGLTPD
jgi:hypothetical protein